MYERVSKHPQKVIESVIIAGTHINIYNQPSAHINWQRRFVSQFVIWLLKPLKVIPIYDTAAHARAAELACNKSYKNG